MKSEWSVRFYGDWNTYFTVLRKAEIVSLGDGDARAKARADHMLETRSMPSDEDDPITASLVVENAEELADVLAVLRADKSGGYGWGVGYQAKTTEADVWVGIGGTDYYGRMLDACEVRVDSAKLAGKLRDAMREASKVLDVALQPETP